jgi:hypothetical protein
LGITQDEEDIAQFSSPRQFVIDELFQRLTTLSIKLESAIEFSSSLQVQHAAAQSTISVLESAGGASHITGPTNNIRSTLGGSFVSTHCVLILFISPGEYSYVAISSPALSVCSHAHLTFGTEPGAAQTITSLDTTPRNPNL